MARIHAEGDDRTPPDLARPVSFVARQGEGLERTLVLGGGGIYFVAWQVAYLEALAERGARLGRAERVVGTSAGSLVGSLVTAERLHVTEQELGLLGRLPSVVSHLAGAREPVASQQRALELFMQAGDAEPATLAHIGHAALAAQAPPARKIRRSLQTVLGMRRWPSPALHVTAVDTFTGERLVVTEAAGVTVPRATGASSAVPGLFTPQRLGDRRAMDGGVSGTSTHTDLVAGAGHALVLCMAAGAGQAVPGGTHHVDSWDQELAALQDSGTDVIVRGPGPVDPLRLMDPGVVEEALEAGRAHAAEDADEVLARWS